MVPIPPNAIMRIIAACHDSGYVKSIVRFEFDEIRIYVRRV